MFIQTKLLKGFSKELLYKVPDTWPTRNLVGHLVRVPIQKREEYALVIAQYNDKPSRCSFVIREALSLEPFPDDRTYERFIHRLSLYYRVNPVHFYKRIRSFLQHEGKRLHATQTETTQESQKKTVQLSEEQQTVTDFVVHALGKDAYTPTVLHGVTGSGKTECYKKMIVAACKAHKTTILMLPEVTLALQFERIMRQELPASTEIFGFHSGTTTREKKQLWKALLNSRPLVIIGVHLPILLPINNLGLIIIDEEHEVGYQEKKHPKIDSRRAALLRAQETRIPIILGSATPSLSSLFNVKKRNWSFFQLKKRFSGAFPTIETVLLTDKNYRRNFWISQRLEDEIKIRLQTKEQVIIFLNRRGFSFFVQCKECGQTVNCPNCSVSLTLHNNDCLTCHYCDYQRQMPTICSSCKTTTFLKKGIGTQQIVSILEKRFPQARIGRADMDTTRKKETWKQTITDFEERKIDILVGTQTITKGFHFPGVTLVGIIWADLNLHFPVFNATETTLQQLIQVAGRAGRQSENSTVIVQAMDDHPVFKYVNEETYITFYQKEIETREQLGYPPHGQFVEIELKHTSQDTVEQDSFKIASYLNEKAQKENFPAWIMGPAEPPVSKIKRVHIRKIFIKSASLAPITKLISYLDTQKSDSVVTYTPHNT